MRTAILCLIAIILGAAEDPRLEIRTGEGTIICRLFANECPETVRTICDLAEGRREFTNPTTHALEKRPFYDGLTFHRVFPGFMIQGGCPLGNGLGDPGFKFKDEINAASLGLDKELVLHGDQLNPQCAYEQLRMQFSQLYVAPLMAQHGIGPASPPEEQQKALAAILPELQTVTLRQFYEKMGYVYDDKLPPSHRPLRGALAMANSGPNTNGSQFFINVADKPHLTGKHAVFGQVESGMDVVDRIANAEADPKTGMPKKPVVIISIRVVGAPAPSPAGAPAPSPASGEGRAPAPAGGGAGGP